MPLETAEARLARLYYAVLAAPLDVDRARELAMALMAVPPDHGFWPQIVAARVLGEQDTAQSLLMDAAVWAARGDPGAALRNLASAAVHAGALPDPEYPWHAMRDLIVLWLMPQAAMTQRSHHWPLHWAALQADSRTQANKARLVRGLARQFDKRYIQARWDVMIARATAHPPLPFLPLLAELVRFRDVPDKLSPRHATAIARVLAELPKDELLVTLSTMGKGPIWYLHRRTLTYLVLRASPPDLRGLARPVVERTVDEITRSGGGAAGVTMVIFCGIGHDPEAPMAHFDAELARRGIRAIYLCDRGGHAYIHGLRSLGQTPQDTIDHLRAILAEHPGDKVVTVGMSMSAIAAMAYGLMLKADGILCYAGFISGLSDFRAEVGDDRNPGYAAKAEELAGPYADVRTWLAQYPHRPRIQMNFAAAEALDRAHAQALAGYENVTLHEAAGHTEHHLTAEMLVRGTFGATLDVMLSALAPPDPDAG